MEKVPLTREGYENLKAELERLKRVERPANIRAIEEARAKGRARQSLRSLMGLKPRLARVIRDGQEEVVSALLSGRDALVVMPTEPGGRLAPRLRRAALVAAPEPSDY